MYNRWPGVLLSLALLLSLGVFMKRFDFIFGNEIKALISVIFILSASSLILTILWLIQKKPDYGAHWPNHSSLIAEIPSMHPRGRTSSYASPEVARRSGHIYSIHSVVDLPPKYEDALLNSKPVNSPNAQFEPKSGCQYTSVLQESKSSAQDSKDQRIRRYTVTHAFEAPGSSMAQLALNIVRGFTAVEIGPNPQQRPNRNRLSCDHGHESNTGGRKLSFYQLDVNQLVLLESPPRYSELSLFSKSYEDIANKGTNEPRAG